MNKEKIIKKIEELFYDKSFKEVSMQDIALTIGMKKASLYYHFPSKEELIKEVLEISFKNYLNFIKEIIEKWNNIETNNLGNTSEASNFLVLLKEFLDFSDKNKNIFSIINQNGYDDSLEIMENIKFKQKIIFEEIYKAINQKASFNKEKTFLFLTLINQIGREKSTYSMCDLDKELTLKEIEKIFFI